MSLDALKVHAGVLLAIVAAAFWLRALITDIDADRVAWIGVSAVCWPCGTARGLWLKLDGVPIRQRRSSASSAPSTPARVSTAPMIAYRRSSEGLS